MGIFYQIITELWPLMLKNVPAHIEHFLSDLPQTVHGS